MNHKSPNTTPNTEGRAPITNFQVSNLTCRSLNFHLFWGPTYLSGLGARAYWSCCFVLCDNTSEIWVSRHGSTSKSPRTNLHTPRVELMSRDWSYHRITEGQDSCLLWGLTYLSGFEAWAYYLCCFILHNNHSEVQVSRPDVINNYTGVWTLRANHLLPYVMLQYFEYSPGPTSKSRLPNFFSDSKSKGVIDLHTINDWQ